MSKQSAALAVKHQLVFAALTVAYVTWASVFIWRTSTMGSNGTRYFAVFDDGMISMRYARHLAEGLGPVWNHGEHVEGYTNPLWVLVMSIAVRLAGPHWAPLIIQLTGLTLVVVSAFLVRSAAFLIAGTCIPLASAQVAGLLAGALVYAYYPISFWALDGMEVSGLTLLVAAGLRLTAAQAAGEPGHPLPWLVGIALVAYFLRPDGFLQLGPLIVLCGWWVVRNRELPELRRAVAIASAAAAVIAVHLAWRQAYYGVLVPNTYVLKIEGYDLSTRLRNGSAFAVPYVYQTFPGLCIALSLCLHSFKQYRQLIVCWSAVPVVATAYQVYVGGDPFLVWRQLTPAFCAIAALTGCGVAAILSTNPQRATALAPARTALAAAGLSLFMFCVDASFVKQIVGKLPPYNVQRTHDQVRRALAWSEIATPEATALLFNAGTLPYFWDGKVYDALGKMDPRIARLKPDRAVAWDGMQGVPGHAKFDLQYSLVGLKPDYIEKWVWFSQDMTRYVSSNYTAVRPSGSDVTLCVRSGSPHINWSGLEPLGDCTSNLAAAR